MSEASKKDVIRRRAAHTYAVKQRKLSFVTGGCCAVARSLHMRHQQAGNDLSTARIKKSEISLLRG